MCRFHLFFRLAACMFLAGVFVPVAGVSGAVSGRFPSEEVSEDVPALATAGADTPPGFGDGGVFTFKRWVLDRMTYPAGSHTVFPGGVIGVKFRVTSSGKVTQVRVKEVIGAEYVDDIRRIVRSSPRWTPAFGKGCAVASDLDFRLEFVLRDTLAADGTPVRQACDLEIYENVDSKPRFGNGGVAEFADWIRSRVLATDPAAAENPERMLLCFSIEPDGSVSRLVLDRPVGAVPLRQRVMETAAQSPAWTPGRIEGIPVTTACEAILDFGSVSDGAFPDGKSTGKYSAGESVGMLSDRESEGESGGVQPDAESVGELSDGASVLSAAETMPSFRGGDLNDFRDWMVSRIRYPANLARDRVGGRVLAAFVVEIDGSVSHVEILSSPDQRLSALVSAAIRRSPRWEPGIQHGKKVCVRFVFPVDFNP